MDDLFAKKIDTCAKRRGFTNRKKRNFREHANKALRRLVRDAGGAKTPEMENKAIDLAELAVRRETAVAHTDVRKFETLRMDANYLDEERRADVLLGAIDENEGGYLTAREALTNGSVRQTQQILDGEYTDIIAAFLPSSFLPTGSRLTNRNTQLEAIEAAMTGGDNEMANAFRELRQRLTDDANAAVGLPDYVAPQDNPLPNLARMLRRNMIGEDADRWIESVAGRVTNSRAELLAMWERAKNRIDDSIDDKTLDDLTAAYLSPKTAEDYLALAREFTGSEDLHALWAREININSKQNALWQIFGVNAERNFRNLVDTLVKERGKNSKLRAAFYNMRGDFDTTQEIAKNGIRATSQKTARVVTSAGRASAVALLPWTFLKQHIGVYGRVLKTISTGQGNIRGMVSMLDAVLRSSQLGRFADDPRMEEFAREFMLQDHLSNVRLYQNRKVIGEATEGFYGDGAAEKATEWAKRSAAKGTLGATGFHHTLAVQRRAAVRADARGLTRLAKKYQGKSYAEFIKETGGDAKVLKPLSYSDRALWQESRWGEAVWTALQREIANGTAFNDNGFISPGRFANPWLRRRFGMRANAKASQFSGYITESSESRAKFQSNPGSWARTVGDLGTVLLRDMLATTGTAIESVTKPIVYGGVSGIPTSLGFAGLWAAQGIAGYWLYYQIKHMATYGEQAEWVGRNPAQFARRAMDLEVLGALGGFWQTRFDDEVIPLSPAASDVAGITTELINAFDPTEETKTWEFVSNVLEGNNDEVREGVAAIVKRVLPVPGRDILAATIDPERESILQR